MLNFVVQWIVAGLGNMKTLLNNSDALIASICTSPSFGNSCDYKTPNLPISKTC